MFRVLPLANREWLASCAPACESWALMKRSVQSCEMSRRDSRDAPCAHPPTSKDFMVISRECPRDASSSRSPVMKSYSLSQVEDHVLLRDLATLVSQDRATT